LENFGKHWKTINGKLKEIEGASGAAASSAAALRAGSAASRGSTGYQVMGIAWDCNGLRWIEYD
jgi:hypothetical protein